MQNYVLGFLFNNKLDKVILIEKNRPEFLKGKLNGIGGKVELNETYIDAIVREFKEETGIDIHHEEWNDLGEIKDNHFFVQSFYAKVNDKRFDECKTMETEKVLKFSVNELNNDSYSFAPHVLQIINEALFLLNKKGK